MSSTTAQPTTTRVTQPPTTKPTMKVMKQEENEFVFEPQNTKRFVKKPLLKSSNDLYIIEFDEYMKQIKEGVVELKTNKLPKQNMKNIEEGKRYFTIS